MPNLFLKMATIDLSNFNKLIERDFSSLFDKLFYSFELKSQKFSKFHQRDDLEG